MKTKNKTWTLGNGAVIDKIRIYADEGKAVTHNGAELFGCVDVDSIDGWYEVNAPIEPIDEEATLEDYEAALAELGVK